MAYIILPKKRIKKLYISLKGRPTLKKKKNSKGVSSDSTFYVVKSCKASIGNAYSDPSFRGTDYFGRAEVNSGYAKKIMKKYRLKYHIALLTPFEIRYYVDGEFFNGKNVEWLHFGNPVKNSRIPFSANIKYEVREYPLVRDGSSEGKFLIAVINTKNYEEFVFEMSVNRKKVIMNLIGHGYRIYYNEKDSIFTFQQRKDLDFDRFQYRKEIYKFFKKKIIAVEKFIKEHHPNDVYRKPVAKIFFRNNNI